MGQFVSPKVYLLGYTNIDRQGLEDYLRATGNEDFLQSVWQAKQEGLSDGEVLCSFYAKLCYQSLTLGKNANISRTRDISSNLAACFDQGHGSVFEHAQLNFVATNVSRVFTHELVRHRVGSAYCLAGETEIWGCSKVNGRWEGVRKKWSIRKLYEWSQDKKRKGRLKLIRIRCLNEDGEFVPAAIKGVTCSGLKEVYLVTLSNGRSIRCSKDHRFLTGITSNQEWKPLRELAVGNRLAVNGKRVATPPREVLQTLYLTDGLTQREIAGKFAVSEALVKKWLAASGIKKPGGGYFGSGHQPWNKGVTGYATWHHTEETKKILSDMKKGEKNYNWKGGLSLKEESARRQRESVCSKCGSTDQLHIHHRDRDHWNDSPENLDTLCNSCHQKTHYEEDGSSSTLVPRWVTITSIECQGQEMTYDLEVDHPSHNFVANGIVTHNSQTSGRYCRGDKLDLVVDPILEPVFSDISQLQSIIESSYRAMVEKMGLNEEKDFTKKKKITSALRRILPNGQSNEIGFSLNLRTLRHIMQVRTSRHAEWEIREVFAQVYQITKEKFPLLYYGAKEEIIEGIIEVSGMKQQPY